MVSRQSRRTPALEYFRKNLFYLDHEIAYFLMSLDLAIDIPRPPPTAEERKWEHFEFLDLCRNRIVGRTSVSKADFTKNVDTILGNYMNIYHMRYFNVSLENLNDERKLDLEKKIYKYMKFCKSVYSTRYSSDKWYVYHKISYLMFDADIRNGELWKELFKIIHFEEYGIPKQFYETPPKKIEYMLTCIKNYFKPMSYRYVQNTMSIHMAVIIGHPQLLKVLLQMGQEYVWHDITQLSSSPLWTSFFGESYASVMRMKPEYISLRRFLLYLHIIKYAEVSGSSDVVAYWGFPEKLNLLWRALPDPIITRKEIRKDFEEEMNTHYPLNASLISEKLDKVLSDSPSEPRLLQHLARCTIRKTLNERCLLPEGIDQLGLPASLRSYLKLEW